MNRFAIINNGVVINVVSATTPDDLNYPASDVIDIGELSVERGYFFLTMNFQHHRKQKMKKSPLLIRRKCTNLCRERNHIDITG